MDINEKLRILSGAAKYDVSCSSSGSNRSSKKGDLGSVASSGICHSFTPDGRCISLLKILLTNYCIYDCAYCINRRSNDVERAAFTADEVVELTMNFYRRNYIEGLFLSSAVFKNANFTMETLTRVVEKLRVEHGFKGYIHLKAIPGADDELIKKAGSFADRMSVNLELPSSQSLKLLAPEKTKETILQPMKLIKNNIQISKTENRFFKKAPLFVPGGQSTQLIVGATKESDLNILNLSEGLYNKYSLKRVYYSAYVPVNTGNNLPELRNPPTLREHRLYQGDWLLRLYGFKADELLSDRNPNFDINFDPKTFWALNNIHLFPIEINRAPYEMLIRIPGIGIRGAQKIMSARKINSLNFYDLKKLGVVLKRAQYFITCKGKYFGSVPLDEERIKDVLTPKFDLNIIEQEGEQLNLFDHIDKKFLLPKDFSAINSSKKLLLLNDKSTSLTGEI
ncbi:putative DNA modification/repair radical SAM protein [Clostridium sp. YIM B02505]|uniref:DNA modification/repair radical SAM protein n=1 Tax=Clostridium yunnanense TaxID=2800325 RepID=A0ABS1EIS8_9CLOT|nr:putative DNA modification/repair radical SAM protein [Clostridium yunnanense]MBK1809285.1 putative DNA modification/repair radical SAM protein [Clostridium yunnanense]